MQKYNAIMEKVMLIIAIASTVYVAYLLGSQGMRTEKDYFILIVPFFSGLSYAMRRSMRLRHERQNRPPGEDN
ncbi:MAG: hypothetical protein ACFB10_12140 [Salibacteraceae bacterium]